MSSTADGFQSRSTVSSSNLPRSTADDDQGCCDRIWLDSSPLSRFSISLTVLRILYPSYRINHV